MVLNPPTEGNVHLFFAFSLAPGPPGPSCSTCVFSFTTTHFILRSIRKGPCVILKASGILIYQDQNNQIGAENSKSMFQVVTL